MNQKYSRLQMHVAKFSQEEKIACFLSEAVYLAKSEKKNELSMVLQLVETYFKL